MLKIIRMYCGVGGDKIKSVPIESISKIEGDFLSYEIAGVERTINLKQSANSWWDKHNKCSLLNTLCRKKKKNIYVGDKCCSISGIYMRFYEENGEILFIKELEEDMDTSDFCEFHWFWDDLNKELNMNGYWLFDEG